MGTSQRSVTSIRMHLLVYLWLAVCLASPVFSACASQTQLNIEGYGAVYVMTDDWARDFFHVDGSSFTFGGGSMGFQFALDEKHFDYDVDLSKTECGCNADITFVDMPG